MLYCVLQLCNPVTCTLIWAVLTGKLGPVGLRLVSFCVCFLRVFFLTRVSLYVIRSVILFCVYIIWLFFDCQYQWNWLSGKTRLQNDLLCQVRCSLLTIHYSDLLELLQCRLSSKNVYQREIFCDQQNSTFYKLKALCIKKSASVLRVWYSMQVTLWNCVAEGLVIDDMCNIVIIIIIIIIIIISGLHH